MHDYKGLGFRCGLEIHQQLDTGKLFCRCKSIVHDSNPTIHIHRRLRPVAGEGGKIDAAALFEATKGKFMIYEGCKTSSCLVELDEEPPAKMDEDALKVVIQAAKMFHANIVDEVLVMRKIVIDGSNVSGFQRTSLIAEDGWIETSKGKVSVQGIYLEEEAAQKAEEDDKHITYRLDRLGVPLIEVQTGTEIVDPEHAEEVAQKIGMILRSTGKVKRGIGTIRQDVNVSIKGGARTEIKGFQELKSIPKVIEYEIGRQQELQKQNKHIDPEVRKAEPDLTTSFLRPMPGAKRMYPETDVPSVPIPKSLVDSIALPKLIEEQITDLTEAFGIDTDIATTLVSDNLAGFFSSLAKSCKNLKPAYIADLLLSLEKQLKKQFNIEIKPSEDDLKTIMGSLDKNTIPKEAVLDIFHTAHKESKPIAEVLGRFKGMSDQELEAQIRKIISENPGVQVNALMGKVMAVLRGKADGKKITDMIKKLV